MSRILTAATEEITQYGLAGARVDRIARPANSNVRLVYAHFSSMEDLFSIALECEMTALAELSNNRCQRPTGVGGAAA